MGMISITTSAGGQRGHGGFVKQADGWVGGEEGGGRGGEATGCSTKYLLSVGCCVE